MLIPNSTSGKDVYTLATYTLNIGSGMVGPKKPGLTHLSLVHNAGPHVVLSVHYQ